MNACENGDKQFSDNEKGISKGIVKGTIGIYMGNCMPVVVCEPTPVSTTVAVTEPSANFNINLLIDSVMSGTDGSYEFQLPKGNYSLFLRDTNGFVCESWSCPEECYCTFFSVKSDSTTEINVNIDHAYW